MAAAKQQPENGIQSGVHSVGSQTPPAKNREPRQLVFQEYTSGRAKSTRDEVAMVDDQVRVKLTNRTRNPDKKMSHLYVFSSPEAKGFYKVGRGQNISRPTKDQERCYPNHELHCYIECPNAPLFERVVHAEFHLSRRKHWCNRCKQEGKTHIEWIQAPLQDILDSVTAWSMYARWLYQCGNNIDEQQSLPLPGFSDRADRWRNWALEETLRWMKSSQGRVAFISRKSPQERKYEAETAPEYGWETRSDDQYFSDAVPGLSDSPETTPGSGGIRDPPTPATPTPAGRGLEMGGYARKQKNALRITEEEADWEYATTKPTVRALFINRGQRPSEKKWPLPRAEDPASHDSLTEGDSRGDEDRASESSREKKGYIQDISDADIDEKVRKVIVEVVSKVQEINVGSSQEFGTIHLLSLESAKGFYRVCCRKGNGSLSREKECYDNTTRFHDIANYTAVKKLLLMKFKVSPPVRICGRCSRGHRDWIKLFEGDTTTRVEPSKGPVNKECLDVQDHACELSKGDDRRNVVDAVAEMQKDKTAAEDVPINIPPAQTPAIVDYQPISSPNSKTNGSVGRPGGMLENPTVSTEQQAPGLMDVGIAAVRSVLSGLL